MIYVIALMVVLWLVPGFLFSFRFYHRDWLRHLRHEGAPTGLHWWQGWFWNL